MIREDLNMYKNGELNKDFLKGKILFNGSSKVEGSRFGRVIGFYIAKEENKTHKGKRFFIIEKLDTRERKNWWLDLKDGLNKDLFLINEKIEIKK